MHKRLDNDRLTTADRITVRDDESELSDADDLGGNQEREVTTRLRTCRRKRLIQTVIRHCQPVLLLTAACGLLGLTGAASGGDDLPKRDESANTKSPSIDELLLFFPSKHPAGNWAPDDLRFENVWFTAEDQTRLHGWYCPCENARAVILIAHGNAGSIASRASLLRYLQKSTRVATLMFDYRGYGRSEGVPTVEGVLQDARAARTKLCQLARIKDSEMLLMGESLGGAIVVQLAAESAPRGLILQSTFSSLRQVADFHYPRLAWLVPPTKLDSLTQIARYRGPLLQSHGNVDRTIPYDLGKRLFESANEPKSFVTIPGADHNNWFTLEYQTRLDEFLANVARDVK
jgi:fermentation-respiration switch protein FrsA (DUF1100 family)